MAGALAVAAMATACTSGGNDGDKGGAGTPAAFKVGRVGTDSGGTPVKGGTLTFSAYAEAGLLDPAKTIVAGSTGGVEMAALYDVLMRWDAAAGKVVPKLAKELKAHADAKTWTLTLREGVKFSDGTTLDAKAVKWSIERYVDKGGDEAALWKANVDKIETPDDLTVVFTLAKSWAGFDFLLTTGPGMIVAKSADSGGKFTPVGAGPFAFGGYKPKEETVLNARDDYWDGRPNLDRLRIVYIADPNAALDGLKAGQSQMVFLRDPVVARKALDSGLHGLMNMVALGNVAIINGAKDRPGGDPRVRQALFHAINPEVIYQRAYSGSMPGSSEVFPSFSHWHTGTKSLAYDPAKAKALLAEAKAAGYDGNITYTDGQDPASQATALAVKAMLESVGFKVELNLLRTVADQISQVVVKRDYDVSGWGLSWREAGPFGRMFATMHSKGNSTVGMPTSPEMDALIEQFQGAKTEDEQRAIMGRIQEQWNRNVPALVFGPLPEFVAWPQKVHGVTDTVNSMVLLDDAWLGQS